MNKKPKRKGSASERNASGGVKRYQMLIPMDLYDQLEDIAESKGVPVVTVVRQFIALGISVTKNPETTIVLKTDGNEREIQFLF